MQAAVRTGMFVASFPSHEERLLTLREPSMQPSSGAHHREASLSRAQGPQGGVPGGLESNVVEGQVVRYLGQVPWYLCIPPSPWQLPTLFTPTLSI